MIPKVSAANEASPTLPAFPPLERLTSPTVSTAAAAFYLNRRPQTCRTWACLGNGPIAPIRVNGRLAWRVCDIKKLLGIKTAEV